MNLNFQAWALETGIMPILFLLGIFLFVLIGQAIGRYKLKKSGNQKVGVHDQFIAAIYGLTALLIAFSFSSAIDHFDDRRKLTLNEVNSIAAVYDSSLSLMPPDREKLQEGIKNYVDNRVAISQTRNNLTEIQKEVIEQDKLGKRLNDLVLKISTSKASATNALLGQALTNQMANLTDIFRQQKIAFRNHPPLLIFRALLIMVCVVSLLSGYSMAIKKESDLFLAAIFGFLMAGAIFVILTLEFPYFGPIQPDDFHDEFILLRHLMG